MLDPHQMVLASVPDKLLIMTYLHQIKQYFTTPKKSTVDDSECNDLTLATISKAGQKLNQDPGKLIKDYEKDDSVKKTAPSSQAKTLTNFEKNLPSEASDQLQYEPKHDYNPFDDNSVVDSEIGQSTGTPSLDGDTTKTQNSGSKTVEPPVAEVPVEENKNAGYSHTEKQSKNRTIPSKLQLKEDNASEDNTVLYSPKPGYNPFLEDEKEHLASKNEKHSGTTEPLNPFDDDYEEKVLNQSAQMDKPQSLNPFDDDYEEKVLNESAQSDKTKSLNPFDDDYEEPPDAIKVDINSVNSADIQNDKSATSSITSLKSENTEVPPSRRKPPGRSVKSPVTSAKKVLRVVY